MKKILNAVLILFAISLFISCEKDNMGKIDPTIITPEEDTTNVLMSFTTPAQISGDTKMSFEFDQTNLLLKRSWETGDQLIGFVNDGTTDKPVYKYFTFEGEKEGETITWTRISGNEGYPKKETDATLYFVFAPGKEASSFKTDGSITIDLSNQINGQLPVVMSAQGQPTETDGKYKIGLTFTSHLALLCIDCPTLGETGSFPTENTPINYFSINGVSQKVNISPAATTKCEKVSTDNTGITVGQSKKSTEPWTVGKNGAFSKQVFVAFPVTGTEESDKIEISVSAETETARYSYPVSARLYSNEFYRISQKTFKKSNTEKSVVASLYHTGGEKFTNGDYHEFNNAIAAANAINDANTPVTLKVVADDGVVLAGDVPAFNNATNTITLDLNGKTITTGANRRIVVDGEGAELIIKDDSDTPGTIQAYDGAEAGAPVIAMNNAILTINGGNFVSAPTHSVDIDAAVYAKLGATLTINGGTFTSTSSDEGAIGASSVDGSDDITQVFVNGGTINGGSGENTRKAMHMVRANLTIGNAENDSNGPTICGDIDITGKTKQNTLTINKGSITSENNNHTIDIEQNVSATINGGSFCNNSSGKNAIYILSENTVDAPAASLSINGGTFTSQKSTTNTPNQRTIRILRSNVTIGNSESNDTQPIINGEIYATKGDKVTNRTVIINNGRIKCSTSQSIVQTDDNTNMKVVIKGGKFNKGFNSVYLEDGYVMDYSITESVDEVNYNEVKSSAEYDFFLNGVGGTGIVNAINTVKAASDPQYIQLLKDVDFSSSSETATIANAAGLTINLAGHTLIVGKKRIDVDTEGKLTLCSRDVSGDIDDGAILQNASGAYFGMKSQGTLNILGGGIDCNSTSAALSVTGGTANISGGLISSSNAKTIQASAGTVNISGEAVICSENSGNKYYPIYASAAGSYNISGGWIRWKDNTSTTIVKQEDATTGTISITGGKYTSFGATAQGFMPNTHERKSFSKTTKDPRGNSGYQYEVGTK